MSYLAAKFSMKLSRVFWKSWECTKNAIHYERSSQRVACVCAGDVRTGQNGTEDNE